MSVLRRVLYTHALASVVLGVLLAAVPRLLLVRVFHQLPYNDYSLVRLAGIQLIAAAMFAVLVAQRVEDLWFWGWAFAIPTALAFLLFGSTAAIGNECGVVNGLPKCPSSLLWWVLAVVTGVLAAGYVVGLARAGNEAGPV
jgi:hypothetical protein